VRAPKALFNSFRFHIADRLGTVLPRKLRLAVTSRCNARCSMCNAWQRPLEKELSLKDYEALFEQNTQFLRKIKHISFTGGEPTLREDLVQIVRIASSSHPTASININTNGLLVERTTTFAQQILRFRDQATFIVSLDGIGEAHDHVRGIPGAFEKATSTIDNLLNLKQQARPKRLSVEVNFTATNTNYDQFPRILALCRDKSVRLNLVVPMPGVLYRSDSASSTLGTQQARKLASTLAPLQAENYDLRRAILLDLLTGKGRQFDCWAGRLLVFIDANGDVYPNSSCPQEFRLGNITTKPHQLKKILESPDAQKVIAKTRKCRACQVACETGITLKLAESWYSYRRLLNRS